ncbi:hypothetical protein HYZ05_01685 [Candidatus Daviesbacteria bacterium]|nr:hypothetical protein [Candidatus Daviesbacteria bacterium]
MTIKITFNKSSLQPVSQISSAIRAKSFKISSATANFAQYVRTVKAYALAELPLEHMI